jgi:sterol desaturase/sphingolipid hydroxylase (fatty acid hydroxylase superfamily)
MMAGVLAEENVAGPRMAVLLTVFVGGAIVFHLLERQLNRPVLAGYETAFRRQGFLADITSAVVNGPFLTAATKIGAYRLVTLIPAWHHAFARWPWAAQFALFFMVNDLGRYWLHRAYHASDFLWRVHRVHHATTEMDAMSVIRIHICEAVAKNFFLTLPFEVLGLKLSVITVYASWDVLKGFWHHANIRTYIGPLNYIFNSAEQHWWHHSVERRGNRSNYGSILSIWDVMFGTFYWPKNAWPDKIGVNGLTEFPEDFVGQFTSVRHDDAALIGQRQAAKAARATTDVADASSPVITDWVEFPESAAKGVGN